MDTNLHKTLLDRHAELRAWLLECAYPLWKTSGYDSIRGGFQERLYLDGTARDDPRRARVQPRQIYCFAMAPRLGFRDDVEPIVVEAVSYLLRHYQRPDGLFRQLIDYEGRPLDERPALYDQAFMLLAFATVSPVFDRVATVCVEAARRLRTAIATQFRTSTRGFHNGLPSSLPLQANPHMHLIEACLAWAEVSDDEEWRALADEIGTLALERFIDSGNGVLREFFNDDWTPAPSPAGRLVEPGHQFEWGWLLTRWDPADARGGLTAARRLIEIGEEHGVRGGVAINGLLDDFSVQDEMARLWPQTERLKAASLSARLTGEIKYFTRAGAAAAGLFSYFDTPTPGLWRDRRTPAGTFLEEPAPASSFYHIVAGIAEFDALIATLSG